MPPDFEARARKLWLGNGKDALNFGDDPDEPEQARRIKVIATALRAVRREALEEAEIIEQRTMALVAQIVHANGGKLKIGKSSIATLDPHGELVTHTDSNGDFVIEYRAPGERRL